MALAAGKQLPISGCDSAYRPYDRQVYLYNHCPYICAVPGTSNHGNVPGAVDVLQWVRSYIDSTHGAFGFDKSCSDAPSEWWHVVFCRPFTRPNPGTHLHSPRLVRGSGGPGQAPWVRKLQKLLRRHGAKHLAVDGDLGAHTCYALKRFRKAEHLEAACATSLKTWKKLRAPVVNPHPHPAPHPHGHKGPVYGVDVAQYQGDVNWNAVSHDHKRFAIVKATEGEDYKDPTFSAARLDAIEKAGLVPGVYHFLRPRSDRPGSREATWFVHVITAAGYGKGMLPPVVDVETTTLSPAGTCSYVRSFYRQVKATLYLHAIIYTYPGFAQTYLSGCKWIGTKRLWIANYGVNRPTVLSPWSSYLLWQFTSTGHVAGINGAVDVDKLPGGLKVLRKLQIDPARKLTKPQTAKAVGIDRFRVAVPSNPLAVLPQVP